MQINCTDRCGRWVVDENQAAQQGWTYLEITRRWRCPACVREAVQASTMKGTDNGWPFNEIPPSSIGALKPTADTITPPVVPLSGGGGDFAGGGADTSYKTEQADRMFEAAEQSMAPAPEPSPSPSPSPEPSPSPSPSPDW